MLELLRNAPRLDSSCAINEELYGSWPVRYHLCPERANLLRHLRFDGLRVVELGAGMGGVSRFLAERAASLTVVEGTSARFAALGERLRDLSNWRGHVANIQDVEPPRDAAELADVVCLIGVLEYSELHVRAPAGHSPFSWMLERARRWLAPDGVLLLAIENRLGLKYWAGAPEDHTDRAFDGIVGYPRSPSPRTFARGELRALLAAAGLSEIVEYYPFPDYKIPSAVLTRELCTVAPDLAAELASSAPFEAYGAGRMKLFPEYLALRSIAGAGLLPELANSFLFLAADGKTSTLSRLYEANGELGWHYSVRRRIPTRTVFSLQQGELSVRKEPLAPATTGAGERVSWHPLREAVVVGEAVRERLLRAAYFAAWSELAAELGAFLRWSLAHWTTAPSGELDGRAIDAVWLNAKRQPDGNFALFDLEWRSHEPVPPSWLVLRNVHVLDRERDYLAGAPFRTLAQLYEQLCRELGIQPALDADLRREADFQAHAHGSDPAATLAALRALFERAIPPAAFGAPGAAPAGGRKPKALARALRRRVREQLRKRPKLEGLMKQLKSRLARQR